jgi:hypothetical protein
MNTIDFGLVRLLIAPSRNAVMSETACGAVPVPPIDRPAFKRSLRPNQTR